MKIPIFCNIYKFLLLNLMKFGRQSPSIVPNDLSDQPSTEHFSLVPSWWNLVCSRFALFRSQLNCVIYEFLIFCDCHCKKKEFFTPTLTGVSLFLVLRDRCFKFWESIIPQKLEFLLPGIFFQSWLLTPKMGTLR